MGLYDTYNIKVQPDKPYMTGAELVMFQKLRNGGALSVFRCTECKNCKAEIPKPKQFCGRRCYEIGKAKDGEEEHGQVD